MLIDVMNVHGLEQLVHFPAREKNTMDLIFFSLPGQLSLEKETSEKVVFVPKAKYRINEERCTRLCKR